MLEKLPDFYYTDVNGFKEKWNNSSSFLLHDLFLQRTKSK